jgi:KDO2-lipid IV(A) lauroyltransferase
VGWRRWAYLGARFGPRAFVRWSPPLIGLAFAVALPQARAQVRRNLRRVYGARDELTELRDVAATFASFAACLAESLAGGRLEAKRASYRVRGAERFEALRASGQGLLLATAHVGPWDAAAQALRAFVDEPILLVMGGEADDAAADLQDVVRRGTGLEVCRVGRHPLDALPALDWLRAGKMVAVQMDRPVPTGALRVPLFGRPFSLPRGPFALARLAGVPLLPVFASRRGFFDYRIDVGHPIAPPVGTGRSDFERAARAFGRQFEQHLRGHATQWFHFTDAGEGPTPVTAAHDAPAP